MARSILPIPSSPPSLRAVGEHLRGLPLVRLQVIDSKLLQLGAVHAQVGGFLHGAVGVPMIHGHTLDEPHRRRASAARAMDEGWFSAFRGDCVEKLVRGGGIRRIGIEWDAVVSQARGLCCLPLL